LIALLALLGRAGATGGSRFLALRQAYRLAASLPTAGGELAVIDHPELHACAVPGRPGRIVVFRGLLRSLDAQQRRAVLAHERAHLVHHHHIHHTVAWLAAAANPLLYRLPAAIALSTERWADECAAETCSRETVEEALVRAAVHRKAVTFSSTIVLAAVVTNLAARIEALRTPAPAMKLWRVALLIGLLIAIGGTVLEAVHDTDRLFDLAQAAYRTAGA
jgi:Zn-dependent protease with chaperone function